MTLRFLTAGESHGLGLTGILEGLPAGLPLTAERLTAELQRRQQGAGRGGRMRIESDAIQITGGVRDGRTLGGPVSLWLPNRDWPNWKERMRIEPGEAPPEPVTLVRPGHIDLAGTLKLGHSDVRNSLERASARETAMRVAIGTCCRLLLEQVGIALGSRVLRYGPFDFTELSPAPYDPLFPTQRDWERLGPALLDQGTVALEQHAETLLAVVEEARAAGTTLGGTVQVLACGLPPGLGHFVHWDRRLDGRLGQALLSIPAVKGVAIGAEVAGLTGQESNDALHVRPPAERGEERPWWYRLTNHMGGIEGGVTNGEPVVVRCELKPLSTQTTPLPSIDLATGEAAEALVERTDTAVVEAAAVVAEAMVAFVLAQTVLEQCGAGGSLEDFEQTYHRYCNRVYQPRG